MKYLDDLVVGERFALGSRTFQADEIKAFAKRFDPQRFHIDEAEAERSHFGALCASGWHTACVWMRLMIDYRKRLVEGERARGEKSAAIGPAPGFRNLKWLKPVFVGDTIAFAAEVIETRVSNSRPGWGLLTQRGTGVNQRGETVLSFESTIFLERRPGAG
jgi:acyl dehydratase